MKARRYSFIAIAVFFMAFAFSDAVYGSFWDSFEENMSFWDPIGNALDPIEEAVPGLFLRGFVRNRSYMNTHGTTESEGVAGIPREWKFANIFWEAEFEWRYKFSQGYEDDGKARIAGKEREIFRINLSVT